MVTFNQHIVLSPDTEARVDIFLHHIDAFIAFLNASSISLNEAISAETVMNFQSALKSIATITDKTITPETLSTALTIFQNIASTFDNVITTSDTESFGNALKSIESTVANIDAITGHIRNFTNIVTILFVGLCVSVMMNIMLVFYVRKKNRTIATLKERRKKAQ